MKDIQGIQRGKCNNCECMEYMTSEERSRGLACEYCGHLPVDHVRIIPLGRCKTKDCDCDKYSPEDPNSYSECQYCGCQASTHEGAEALRKKPQGPPALQSPPQATVPVMSVAGGQMKQQGAPMGQPGAQMTSSAGTFVTGSGGAVQTFSQGKCSFPSCQFGRRVEGNKVHPYCSRTCAQKHGQMQSSFHAQKIASANQAAMTGSSQPAAQPLPVQQLAGQPTSTQQPIATAGGAQMCKNCKVNPANPGRGWCQSCYQQQQRP